MKGINLNWFKRLPKGMALQPISIWLDGAPKLTKATKATSPQTDIRLEMHLNYWNVRKFFFRSKYFLDIGILIPKAAKCDILHLHVPDPRVELKNLGDKFKNKELARAVFNEDLTSTDGEKQVELSMPGKIISVYNFSQNEDVDVQKLNGKMFGFKVAEIRKRLKDEADLYLRLRLSGKYIRKLLKVENRGAIAFESVFTSTQVVDARINQMRSLDDEIKEKLTNGLAKFSKVHFFLIVPSRDEYTLSSETLHAARHIENTPWANYIEDKQKSRLFVDPLYTVYHWKRTNQEEKPGRELGSEFVLYAKFKRTRLGWRPFFLYLMVAIGLGILSNFLYDRVRPDNQCTENKSGANSKTRKTSKTNAERKSKQLVAPDNSMKGAEGERPKTGVASHL